MFKKWLFSFLLLSAFADAETLFYKKDGSQITPQEHEILYKIMLETQFPMSVAYGKYYEDEIKAMNEKIQAQLPNAGIEATFIPIVLYELLILKFIAEHRKKILNLRSDALKSEDILIGLIHTSLMSEFLDPSTLKKINHDKKIILWHLNINNYIVSLFKKNAISFPLDFKAAISAVKELKLIEAIDYLRAIRPATFSEEFYTKIGRAIAIEYQAHTTNQMLLYRGSSYVDDFFNPKLINVPNRSISFGASLFGGFLFDPAACAYCFMAKNYYGLAHLGYVVFLDKKAYFDGKLKNMFYIPPIITLANIVGGGEHFHPRTKVVSMEGGIAGLAILNVSELKKVFPYYQIKAATKEEAQKIHDEMLQYIKGHHLVFKDQPKARL